MDFSLLLYPLMSFSWELANFLGFVVGFCCHEHQQQYQNSGFRFTIALIRGEHSVWKWTQKVSFYLKFNNETFWWVSNNCVTKGYFEMKIQSFLLIVLLQIRFISSVQDYFTRSQRASVGLRVRSAFSVLREDLYFKFATFLQKCRILLAKCFKKLKKAEMITP